VARTGYRPLAEDDSLLLIILDDLRRANLRVVRIKPDVAKGTSLAQEVPALIQFDLDLHEPFTIGLGVCPLLVQSVFLFDKALNMIEDRLIFDLILHESLLPHGCEWNGQALMLRPPETAVNRATGQVLQSNISRRLAGIWFIWPGLFVSSVWFDEREKQDTPRAPDRLPLNHLPLTQGSDHTAVRCTTKAWTGLI
jgi:hypothetical protein